MINPQNIPLTLYIHYPWCEKKCPYCDFNSHITTIDNDYIDVLILDLKNSLKYIQGRKIAAIFIGGGTPSLMSIQDIAKLFEALNKYLTFEDDIEITIESNPSSAEVGKFKFYKSIGINRISIGIQSFDDKNLKFLGRIHNAKQAQNALTIASETFANFNLDIIFGLQSQSLKNSQNDLKIALSFNPSHISFYQLTIEPNTYFSKFPPILPSDERLYQMMESGIELLENNDYKRYEVSAYGLPSKHNLNYWKFGDYIGIGSGAHGKITTTNGIIRTTKLKSPKDYIFDNSAKITQIKSLDFDFMLNALRLKNGFDKNLFTQRTGQDLTTIKQQLTKAKNLELITINNKITPTTLGFNHLNSLQELFLP